MPRPMLFEATQRPQALPSTGVATKVDSCGLRMFSHSPPHPPTMENRPDWGQAEQERGPAIAKDYDGGWRVCQKSVDLHANRAAGRMALSKTPSHFSQNIHENCVFIHGFGVFIHGLLFAVFAVASSSYFSFTNEKERDREAKRAKTVIHGFLNSNKKYPRIYFQSPLFSWLKFWANVNVDADLGRFLALSTHPRRKMPMSSLKVVRNER